MRIFGKGFLHLLVTTLALVPAISVLAATSVTSVDHVNTADGDVQISLSTSGDVPQVSVFATENPARIVLDLADTENQAGSDTVHVGQGAVQQYSAIGAGGRTRLVVDMSRSVAYDYDASTGAVTLTISAGGAQTAAAAPASGGGAYNVTGIDFRRGDEGQARIIVSLDRPGASMSMREETNALALDVFNANLPDSLDQRLDVIDFATPVQFIDSLGTNSGVR
ncbi:MAG: AMIN domain-containing protein, partial [Gammaproteobacteria bacterium]|nr:AMIN domain-containing protein [Gammaproteobacteria bacterium]